MILAELSPGRASWCSPGVSTPGNDEALPIHGQAFLARHPPLLGVPELVVDIAWAFEVLDAVVDGEQGVRRPLEDVRHILIQDLGRLRVDALALCQIGGATPLHVEIV